MENNFKITDLEKIPFFQEAIHSKHFEFDVADFLECLNTNIFTDTDYLVKMLLNGIVDIPEQDIFCALYLDYAITLKNWHIPGLSEYDDDEGLEKLMEWSKVNHSDFYNKRNLENYEWLSVGAHLYYSLLLFKSIESKELRNIFCYSAFNYIQYCVKCKGINIDKEITDFKRFLLHRKLMNADVDICIEGDLIVKGIRNKNMKYEFFTASDSMEAYQAMENSYINRSEYDNIYCLPDNDETDIPVVFYNSKLLDGEFDSYKVFQDEEEGEYSEYAYLALLKEQCWKVYELSLDIEEDDFTRYLNVRIKELEELSGLEIGNIEYHVLDIICNYNKENN